MTSHNVLSVLSVGLSFSWVDISDKHGEVPSTVFVERLFDIYKCVHASVLI